MRVPRIKVEEDVRAIRHFAGIAGDAAADSFTPTNNKKQRPIEEIIGCRFVSHQDRKNEI